MPAAFAHCLMAIKAIDKLLNIPGGHPYVEFISENNQFVIMGATSPDYPYLTDPILYGTLKTYHSWADRMHYENVDKFLLEGVTKLSAHPDKTSDDFQICLSWLLGYTSHVIADSYVHPVINCIVGGPYLFTHAEHAKCEMVQDVLIFNLGEGGVDIVNADPRNGKFGFLRIFDDCSVSKSGNVQLHPSVKQFWAELLTSAHPQAKDYVKDIDPDTWHKNYKTRLNLVADPGPIFKRACGIAGVSSYLKAADIAPGDRQKYYQAIPLPNGNSATYPDVFNNVINKIVETWQKLFNDIQGNTPNNIKKYIEDWNLDTGVDESRIDLWDARSQA